MFFSGFGALFNVTDVTQCHVGVVDPDLPRVGNYQFAPCFASSAAASAASAASADPWAFDYEHPPRDTFVFSFVRDPARTALSAYLELRFRARYRGRGAEAFEELFPNAKGDQSCDGGDRGGGGGSGGGAVGSGNGSGEGGRRLKASPRNIYNTKAAQGYLSPWAPSAAVGFPGGGGAGREPGNATAQFLRYLAALGAGATPSGRDLGRDAYHAWPQALKLDRVAQAAIPPPPRSTAAVAIDTAASATTSGAAARPERSVRRYDAIGRLERLDEDLAAVAALARRRRGLIQGKKAPGPGPGQGGVAPATAAHRHSHAASSCGRVDLANAAVARALCSLYAADYACFGYERPAACSQ